jgi:hypothetical protein
MDGKFIMWYQVFNKVDPPENTYICYAESEDGVTWRKPNLGNVSYRGSRENNIAVEPIGKGLDSPSVIVDEKDSEDRRFKMLVYAKSGREERGLYALYSRDGRSWGKPKLAAPLVGDRTNVMLDRGASNPYVAFTRRHTMGRHHLRRTVYRTESADFEEGSDPELILAPDLADSHDIQFYGMSGFRYGDMHIGFVQCLHSRKDLNDVQLVTSRDGRNWSRTEPRTTFMPVGRSADWDTTWISFSSSPPIRCGDKLWLYYEDRNASHGQAFPFPRGCIGLATMRVDGFASIDAGPCWGWIRTKPFTWPGGDLVVNVNSRAASGVTEGGQGSGKVLVEIISPDGSSIEGFDRGSSEAFSGDSIEHRAVWKSGKAMADLEGQQIKISFHLLNSQLFSFKSS